MLIFFLIYYFFFQTRVMALKKYFSRNTFLNFDDKLFFILFLFKNEKKYVKMFIHSGDMLFLNMAKIDFFLFLKIKFYFYFFYYVWKGSICINIPLKKY